MPEVRVSKAAQQDILNIGRYTQREWGADQRRKYLSGMEQRFQALADSPFLAAERKEFEPPVRVFPYEKHLIVYHIVETGILVLRILHESMDVPAHLYEP